MNCIFIACATCKISKIKILLSKNVTKWWAKNILKIAKWCLPSRNYILLSCIFTRAISNRKWCFTAIYGQKLSCFVFSSLTKVQEHLRLLGGNELPSIIQWLFHNANFASVSLNYRYLLGKYTDELYCLVLLDFTA